MTIKFGTKAETLCLLQDKVKSAQVLPQMRFTVSQWQESGKDLLLATPPFWLGDRVIVRSSAIAEDSGNGSLAGRFESILNVKGIPAIVKAVDQVIASYTDEDPENQVFIQPMLTKVVLSGVAFTKEPNSGAPYFVINYDDLSKNTDSVTSGNQNALKTFYQAKYHQVTTSPELKKIVELLHELETLFGEDSLDVEFAMAQTGQLYLLQARPLVPGRKLSPEKAIHSENLDRIRKKFSSLSKPHPYLHGERSIFGIMPDWNPAEIIGVRPKPLALSLYKELVTDNIWAYQRKNYGYRNLRSFPLLVSFCGLPYVDVRVSANSFIPAETDADLAEKLVNYYLDRLAEFPNYHDKVEFEIVFSCYTLDLPERLSVLQKYGFSKHECHQLQKSLRNLTNEIIQDDGLWKIDIDKIKELESRQHRILNSTLTEEEKIYWLLEDCKRYGTLPFAGLARAGFIAVQMLQSLKSVGIFSDEDINKFMSSLDTVSSCISRDYATTERQQFLKKYGHLRPGTYDITSPRYDEDPDFYFDWQNRKTQSGDDHANPDFNATLQALNKIDELLKKHGLRHDILSFFEFIRHAIEGREYAKFVFSRSLSAALQLLTQFGSQHGISKEDMAFADVKVITELYSTTESPKEALQRSIALGKSRYAISKTICLPPLITHESDISSFQLESDEPNFVTLKSIAANVILDQKNKDDFKGNIIMLPNADPGYDWIFSYDIGGFITMYGGANSHMSIRAAELGIPAVIGSGEVLYKQWAQAKKLKVDCAGKTVIKIS